MTDVDLKVEVRRSNYAYYDRRRQYCSRLDRKSKADVKDKTTVIIHNYVGQCVVGQKNLCIGIPYSMLTYTDTAPWRQDLEFVRSKASILQAILNELV